MDEARRVLERLQRIETLKRASAEPGRLLAELRALVVEGEAWLAAERCEAGSAGQDDVGSRRVRRALDDLDDALGGTRASHPAAGRSVGGPGVEGVVAASSA
jgi:hypothetical protein